MTEWQFNHIWEQEYEPEGWPVEAGRSNTAAGGGVGVGVHDGSDEVPDGVWSGVEGDVEMVDVSLGGVTGVVHHISVGSNQEWERYLSRRQAHRLLRRRS